MIPNTGYIIPAIIQTNYIRPAFVWTPEYLSNPYEIWTKLISYDKDYEILGNYMISNFGNIYDCDYDMYLEPFIGSAGYLFIMLPTNLDNKIYGVHRLVLSSFTLMQPDSRELYCNHIDSKRTNNYLTNLNWLTPSENINYAMQFGNGKKGEDHPYTSITNEQAEQICQLLSEGQLMFYEIADKLGVPFDTVRHISQRETWKHISQKYIFPQRIAKHLSDDEVRFICQGLVDKLSYDDIANGLGYECNKSFKRKIDSIRYGENHTNISKDYPIPRRNTNFTNEQVQFIKEYFIEHGDENKQFREVLEILGIEYNPKTRSSLYKIREVMRKKNK